MDDDRIPAVRLYGGSIAFVAGLYSVWLGSTGRTASAWLMLVLGALVFVHGVALVSPIGDRLGGASGPVMVAYAAVMLANQAWMGLVSAGGRMGPGRMMGGQAVGAVGWEPGMVALAVLMLASGAIMMARRGMR